jgi:hypothetical protein
MKTLSQYFPYKPLLTLDDVLTVNRARSSYKKGDFTFCDNETFVGIEVEVEGVHTNSHVGKVNSTHFLWNNTEDNSLRNNGREFVSLPVRGENISYALQLLSNTLHKSINCVGHEFSERTSVHVHVNCRDLTTEQLSTLVLAYSLVEPVMYDFVGGGRDDNIFCVPLKDTGIASTLADGYAHPHGLVDFISSWNKYAGLNLLPLRTYGTVEFRHMTGTCNIERLQMWIDMLLSLRQYAIKTPFNTLKKLALELNTSSEYVQTLYAIFGNHASMLQNDNTVINMEKACCFVKDCFGLVENRVAFDAHIKSNASRSSPIFVMCDSKGYISYKINRLDKLLLELEQLKSGLTKVRPDSEVYKDYQTAIKETLVKIQMEKLKNEKSESVSLQGGIRIGENPLPRFEWANAQAIIDDVQAPPEPRGR